MMIGGGGFGVLFMLVFWVVIIAVALWVLGNAFPRATDPSSRSFAKGRHRGAETPLEILKRRYAGGEISREEYEVMRRDLGE